MSVNCCKLVVIFCRPLRRRVTISEQRRETALGLLKYVHWTKTVNIASCNWPHHNAIVYNDAIMITFATVFCSSDAGPRNRTDSVSSHGSHRTDHSAHSSDVESDAIKHRYWPSCSLSVLLIQLSDKPSTNISSHTVVMHDMFLYFSDGHKIPSVRRHPKKGLFI